MREKSLVSLFVIALLLAACATPTSAPTAVVTENPAYPAPSSSAATAYPEPITETPMPNPAYPEPGIPGTGTPAIPPSSYEPQPGDVNLQRDQVMLDLESSTIFIQPSDPAQVEAILNGNLSDPCHELRVVVSPPDAKKTINLEVYTLVDPSTACITVIKPFSATIPLGSYTSGEYTVLVNGEKLGTFTAGFGAQPGDDRLTRAQVTVDMENSRLFTTDTQPRLASIILQGNLPTHCHQLRIVMAPTDSENKINLDVYSVYDPQIICNDLIQPFKITFPLGSFSSGHYSVYVNGQLLGEFDG
ncbi:MAG: hypothetical protein WAV05_16475 [Anaerolineales bacterium]